MAGYCAAVVHGATVLHVRDCLVSLRKAQQIGRLAAGRHSGGPAVRLGLLSELAWGAVAEGNSWHAAVCI